MFYKEFSLLKSATLPYNRGHPPPENTPKNAHATPFGLYVFMLGINILTAAHADFYAGEDLGLADQTSVGIKASWAQFDDFKDRSPYDQIRDHEPVHVDGVTPYRGPDQDGQHRVLGNHGRFQTLVLNRQTAG